MKKWSALHGFTVLELLITLSVMLILLGVAVPSFSQLLSNSQSDRLAAKLVMVLEQAKTEAIRVNEKVYVHNLGMDQPARQSWCIVVTLVSAAPASCQDSQSLLTVSGESYSVLQLQNAEKKRWFDPARGMASDAMTYLITATDMGARQAIKVMLSKKSRVRRCAIGGVEGYDAC
ncbi:GspH/FimT family pseudopilin [Photobacterium sp. MCCC 1A19761]|uniref:GspH/FimT family pseudopilin n=1 Tax=Photobacterium sp. MCCC 1A19761 TaxID=3115000 RepID=UPI00307E535A